MNKTAHKRQQRTRRHARLRARVIGTPERPRLAVFRSNRYIYAQLIDDSTGTTLASVDSRGQSGDTQRERATAVGEAIAAAAQKQKIEKAVFDRGGFRYQGVIAALADGAREAGLEF